MSEFIVLPQPGKLPDYMCGDAVISPDGAYRYRLRRWSNGDTTGRWVVMIMLNPSTADAEANDPTVTRQWVRARKLGYPGLWIANLFALRATYPNDLQKVEDPIGPENGKYLAEAIECGSRPGNMLILAWGNRGAYMKQGKGLMASLAKYGIPYHVFRFTNSDQPEHPLYIGYNVPLVRITPLKGK